MTKDENGNELIFYISVRAFQEEALNRIGRELTDDELHYAQKGIEEGLFFDIDTVWGTAIDEAVEMASEEK